MNPINRLAQHVAVANTPMFIIERFRNETEVRKRSRKSSNSLLSNIKKIVGKPTFIEMDQRADAYANIVALFLKNDVDALGSAAGLCPDDPWLGEIARFLIAKLQFGAATYSSAQLSPIQTDLRNTGVKGEVQVRRISL